MNNDTAYQRFATLVGKYNLISICLPNNPVVDSIGAALGLYLALTKLGKSVTIACSSPISATYNLTGIDKIQKNLATGGDSLVVSFPYTDGAIDKVTYNIEGNNFNLVIQPKEGQEKLNPSQVKFNYSGGKVEVIIILDAPTLNSLGELYSANQDQFKGKDVVNVDRHLTNANFGTINIVEKKASSTSEIVLKMLSYLNSQLDREIATNLYSGIVGATNNFTAYSVTPETFEAVAYLLKSGAVKKTIAPAKPTFVTQPAPVQRATYRPQPSQSAIRRPMQTSSFDTFPQEGADEYWDDVPPNVPVPNQNLNQQYSQPARQAKPLIHSKETGAQPDYGVEAKEGKDEEIVAQQKPAPKEWLKPKIFRGSNIV